MPFLNDLIQGQYEEQKIDVVTTSSFAEQVDTLADNKTNTFKRKLSATYVTLRWRDMRDVIDEFITTNKTNNYNCSLLEMVRNNISAI